MEFYQDKGINSYCLDMGGSNPISSSMRIFKILKALNKLGTFEESYIHGHNVGMRVNKTVDVIPARDILGFGTGLSSLGEKRTKFIPNKQFIDLIKTNPMNKFRLFDKESYGYWKSITVDEVKSIYPSDCSLSVCDFENNNQMTYLQKAFNSEQLALESHALRKYIEEDADASLDYIKSKKHVINDDMAVLENGKDKISIKKSKVSRHK
jgi:hypothetical protein